MMNATHMLLVVALLQTLAACGQKGPLVLPDQEHAHKKIVLPKVPAGAPPAAPTPTQSARPAAPASTQSAPPR